MCPIARLGNLHFSRPSIVVSSYIQSFVLRQISQSFCEPTMMELYLLLISTYLLSNCNVRLCCAWFLFHGICDTVLLNYQRNSGQHYLCWRAHWLVCFSGVELVMLSASEDDQRRICSSVPCVGRCRHLTSSLIVVIPLVLWRSLMLVGWVSLGTSTVSGTQWAFFSCLVCETHLLVCETQCIDILFGLWNIKDRCIVILFLRS